MTPSRRLSHVAPFARSGGVGAAGVLIVALGALVLLAGACGSSLPTDAGAPRSTPGGNAATSPPLPNSPASLPSPDGASNDGASNDSGSDDRAPNDSAPLDSAQNGSASNDNASTPQARVLDATGASPDGQTTHSVPLTISSETEGAGRPIADASCVALHIEVELANRGTPVPSPSEDGPLMVAHDDPRLIPGLRLGIDGMAVDGRRSLVIPPSLGYGDAGWGDGAVGPDDTLQADVEVLWAGSPPSWTWDELHQAASRGGKAHDLEAGQGAPLTTGRRGVLMIEALSLEAETTSASMWDHCDAHALDPGSTAMPRWFARDLDGLRPGGSRLVLQPDNAATADPGVDAWVVSLAWVDG